MTDEAVAVEPKKRKPLIKETAWKARTAMMPLKLTIHQAEEVEVAFKALIGTDREIALKITTAGAAAKIIRDVYFKGYMGTELAEQLVVALRTITELGKTAPSKHGNKVDALVALKAACQVKLDGNKIEEDAGIEICSAVCYLVIGPVAAPRKEKPKKGGKKSEK